MPYVFTDGDPDEAGRERIVRIHYKPEKLSSSQKKKGTWVDELPERDPPDGYRAKAFLTEDGEVEYDYVETDEHRARREFEEALDAAGSFDELKEALKGLNGSPGAQPDMERPGRA